MDKKFTFIKGKLLISLILFVSVFSLFFNKNNKNEINSKIETTTVNPLDSFVLGIMDDAWAGSNILLKDTLKLNTWHKYSGYFTGGWIHSVYGGEIHDSIFTDSSLYYDGIKSLMANNYEDKGLKTIMDRPKISYLAWGQRSDYQCEKTIADADYWFYTYTTHDSGNFHDSVDNSIHGDGEKVRYCQPNPGNPSLNSGWIVKDLKANREQINRGWNYEQNDDSHEWYVLPRIRIDSSFAANPGNFNKPVCKIIVLDFNENTIKSVTLKISNFKKTIDSIYHGNYLEEYFPQTGDTNLIISPGGKFNPDSAFVGNGNCKVDFRIWYYGECAMWIDRVRVENQVAHDLLNGYYEQSGREWIRWECNLALENPNYIRNFYIEEFEFSAIPCIKYVNEKIKQITDNQLSLMVALNYDLFRVHTPLYPDHQFTASQINKYLIQEAGLKTYFSNVYALEGWEGNETTDYYHLNRQRSHHPSTLYNGNYNSSTGILSHLINSPSIYDDSLQCSLDEGLGGTKFTHMMKLNDEISKESGVPSINLAQAHLHFISTHKLKEPSNEELNLITNLAVSYGAKGIMYFTFPSVGQYGSSFYFRGFLEPGLPSVIRASNVYGQNKWDAIKKINMKLKKWGPYIMSFDNENRQSYILRNEYSDLYSQTYFSDVVTYKPFGSPPPCNENNPNSNVSGTVFECKFDRYLHVATFQNSEPNTKYFMIINRRCSPFLNDSTNIDENGGRRFVKIKLDSGSSSFSGFNNWSIYNLENDSLIITFDKLSNSYLSLGWYLPGEGKLYKIAPVMQEGGTLVTDEIMTAQSFTCKDTVISRGIDITFAGHNNVVSFADSATIIMDSAQFYSGDNPANACNTIEKNNFKGPGGHNWSGMRFNYSVVKIYESKYENIASPAINFALKMVNCPLADIRNNAFILDTDTAGGINASCATEELYENFNLYINYNTFVMNNSRANAIQVQGFTNNTLPLYIQHNQMTSNGYATGIMLSTITGGVIGYNTITGFSTGMNSMNSHVDLYSNSISNTSNQSKALLASSGSVLNLSTSTEYLIAGANTLTNTSSSPSDNINVQGAVFYLSNGVNYFNMDSTNPITNYHLNGYFPSGAGTTNAVGNCFKLNGNVISDPVLPKDQVRNGASGTLIKFIFLPYNCEAYEPESEEIADIGYDLYDTISVIGGFGEGGGEKNLGFGISDFGFKKFKKEITTTNVDLYNNICIQMRFKNYDTVKNLCYELIESYPDSIESISALSKLYLATILTDTSIQTSTNLKTFYENLILNNPSNDAMISSCFYLIQKCKVRLRQYQQALNGFQQIIEENPYSYDGLLARWDYAATSLFLQGSGGGEKNYELRITNYEFKDIDDEPDDKYNKKRFTNEQRKKINEAVFKLKETKKTKDESKIKLLEEKSENGDLTSRKELAVMKTLKAVNKTYRPEDISEHIQTVNNDIQKVFGNTVITINKSETLIPAEYSLSQNYPNPFNPFTKISFDIPQDGNVKLIVYDLLGREIMRLLNNEFKVSGKIYR